MYVCSILDCNKPATWRHGTWWACDEDIKKLLFDEKMYVRGQGMTAFGTAYHCGVQEAPDDAQEWETVMVGDD